MFRVDVYLVGTTTPFDTFEIEDESQMDIGEGFIGFEFEDESAVYYPVNSHYVRFTPQEVS